MKVKSKAERLRRDAQILKEDARELAGEAASHPAVGRLMGAIRDYPVTSVLVAAAAVFMGSRMTRHRHD